MTNKDNYCVIMGGGIGSRFGHSAAKHFQNNFWISLVQDVLLLQQTFDRFKKVIPTGKYIHRNQ